ncbi:MAG: flagellar biosynthesis protein FlhB [Clostridiales bacterium]
MANVIFYFKTVYLKKKLKKDFFYSAKDYNLQIFAEGEKTEKATPKKRKKAREKGQVLQSKDASASMVLLILFVSLRLLGSYMYNLMVGFMKLSILEYTKKGDVFDIVFTIALAREMIIIFFKVVGPIFTIAVTIGLIANFLQVGPLFVLSALAPKFEKLNPLSGIKKMFSIRSIVELIKSLIKIAIVSYVTYVFVKSEVNTMMQLMDVSVAGAALYIFKLIIDIAIRICAVFVIIGAFDFMYQWWQHEKDLKMTKQEVKDEYKQIEGNPEVKSRIRQKQREGAMRRMMQDVPEADVVITNPTHYAVAIKYDQEKSDAPILLAKGADYTAKRIKEIAKENNIEIVENKGLARSLFDAGEVGKKIPQDLYQAVAEVLAFVYSLKNKVKS